MINNHKKNVFVCFITTISFIFIIYCNGIQVKADESYNTNGAVSFIVDPDNPANKVDPEKPHSNDGSSHSKITNSDSNKISETVKSDKRYDIEDSSVEKKNSVKRLPDTNYNFQISYILLGFLLIFIVNFIVIIKEKKYA